MHIGFLTPEYPNSLRPDGGLGNYIRKISVELISRGHKVTVFVLSQENKCWEDQGIQLYQIKRWKFYWRLMKLPLLSTWLPFLEQWINNKRLERFVLRIHRTTPVDILQTSNYRALGYTLCNNGLLPLVCRCSYYRQILYAANGHHRTFVETIEDWFETSIVVNANAAFAPSSLIANLFAQFEGIRPKVLHSPVNLPAVTSDTTIYQQNLGGKRYLLFFGTLMGVKGVDVLVDALPPLFQAHSDLYIAFIGKNGPVPGNETALDLIHRTLIQYENHIFYHSSLQSSQLYPIIHNSIGVVIPSRVDNYPNTCLEALALGVPVIGTYDSSLEEIIEDGKTGFLAKNNDPESLYESVERLINLKEDELLKMKENIRIAVDSFVAEDRVGQLIEFYKETIANFDYEGKNK